MNLNIEVPNHIAIIMDGNGTWAKKRLLPRNLGHRKGAETLVKIARYSNNIGLKYLTVFAFSTENWSRPQEEVNYLMDLSFEFFEKYQKNLKKDNIRLKVMGRRNNLNSKLQEKIKEVEDLTKDNSGLTLVIAFNYGGKYEIIDATKKIANDFKEGKLSLEDLNDDVYKKYLLIDDLPDVDLLIRTSYQIRISNFMLWQIAYSELYFTKTLWPDFKASDMNKALQEYNTRARRFGGIK